MKKAYDLATRVLTFTSADGSVQTLEADKLSEETKLQAMLHGLSQKVGDSYAGAGSEKDPEAYAREAVKDTIAQLYEGKWRAAGGGGGSRYGLLVLALAAAGGKSVEEAAEIVEGMSDEDKKALQAKPKIKAAIARIKLERAQAALEKAEKAEKEAEAPAA